MTAAARITQADFDRATRAAQAAAHRCGMPTRIIFRLEPREIEIIVGDPSAASPANDAEEWSDDDI